MGAPASGAAGARKPPSGARSREIAQAENRKETLFNTNAAM